MSGLNVLGFLTDVEQGKRSSPCHPRTTAIEPHTEETNYADAACGAHDGRGAGSQGGCTRICLGSFCVDGWIASFRLHVAAGTERRISAAQGELESVRHTTGFAQQRCRVDGRRAYFPAVGTRRSLGTREEHCSDGSDVESCNARLRDRDKLRRNAGRSRFRGYW
jgi:hypothetical protein